MRISRAEGGDDSLARFRQGIGSLSKAPCLATTEKRRSRVLFSCFPLMMETFMRPLLLLPLLAACHGPGPCLDACEDKREFWETCMDEHGTLCDGFVAVDCVDDYEAFQECVDVDFEPEECGSDALEAAGVLHPCANPDDAVESCKESERQLFELLEDDEAEEAREECSAEPESEWDQAFADADCDYICSQLVFE